MVVYGDALRIRPLVLCGLVTAWSAPVESMAPPRHVVGGGEETP